MIECMPGRRDKLKRAVNTRYSITLITMRINRHHNRTINDDGYVTVRDYYIAGH